MKRVLTAVILVPIVVLALFRAPLWLFALLVLAVALLAAREYFDIAEKTGFRPMRGLGYAFIASMFIAAYLRVWDRSEPYWSDVTRSSAWQPIAIAFIVAVACSPFVFMTASLRRETLSQSLGDSAVSLLVIPYVALTLLLLVLVRESRFGALFLLFLMLTVWSGDIGAYYVGRAIGKHKLAPRVSPGKTWEGGIASVMGATIVAFLLFHYAQSIYRQFVALGLSPAMDEAYLWLRDVSILQVILFAVLVNVAAQLGDLFESAIKRGAGVKDSGTLLPGHGGVLDRIDALLFALPVGFIFYLVMSYSSVVNVTIYK